MGKEPYPGPEPLTAFSAHVRQVWEAERWFNLGGAVWIPDVLWDGTAAVVLGLASFLGLTKLVWWFGHR